MTYLPFLVGRLLNTPLLCQPDYVQVALSAISERLGIEPLVALGPDEMYKRPSKEAYFDRTTGIVVMPVVGALAHRGESASPMSGLAAYTAIQNDLTDYMNMSNVKGILLDVDSPGGEVSGLAELAGFISEAAKDKPIYAVANSLMASAAYWMSSGATRIYAAPGAHVGSIGVVTAHIDRSKELEKRGQKVTLIHAGAHKVDGNPYAELPDEVRAGIQASVDHLYGEFVDSVAANRDLDPNDIRKTEAAIFGPDQALSLGLIDGVATFGEALRALQTRVSSPSTVAGYSATTESSKMAERTAYGESDLAKARDEGRASAISEAKADTEKAVAKAKADMAADIEAAMASLFPDNPRAATFVDVLKDGASVAQAAKVAAHVPAPAKAEGKTRTDADLDRIMAANAPGIGAEDDDPNVGKSAKEKRLAEIASVARAHNQARGYISR